LFYVKNICNAHEWTLQLISSPGQGSEFIITIPKYLEA